MKKVFVISMLVVLLLSFQLPADQPAYYSSVAFGPSLIRGTWQNMSAAWFADIRDGVVTLSGDTWTPGTSGLVNVSGTCTLKAAPGNWVMVLNDGGTLYKLVDSNRLTESFSVAVPADWMQIGVYQENNYGANSIKCTLLFEPV